MKTTIITGAAALLLAACGVQRPHRTIETPASIELNRRLDMISLHDMELDRLEAELAALRRRVAALEGARQ
ncbi:MAG TPA: hypothetical protein VGG74_06490 [Kofleriaceae bacterium]|jgi:hypothetical protein